MILDQPEYLSQVLRASEFVAEFAVLMRPNQVTQPILEFDTAGTTLLTGRLSNE